MSADAPAHYACVLALLALGQASATGEQGCTGRQCRAAFNVCCASAHGLFLAALRKRFICAALIAAMASGLPSGWRSRCVRLSCVIDRRRCGLFGASAPYTKACIAIRCMRAIASLVGRLMEFRCPLCLETICETHLETGPVQSPVHRSACENAGRH